MTNIRINETKRTIEVTKAFYKEASKYGTDQYNDLQAVRRDYPNFKVVTNKTANKSNGFKGLTLEYMENYIKGHDNDNEIMSEFNILCGKDQDGNKVEFAESASYGEIKKWFLNTYPQIKEYHNKLENILKKSA